MAIEGERGSAIMDSGVVTGSYGTQSLARALKALESRFSMSSAEFFEAHSRDEPSLDEALTGYLRHTWASYYAEWVELTGQPVVSDEDDPLADQIERELQAA
jgi:hypothetical protein